MFVSGCSGGVRLFQSISREIHKNIMPDVFKLFYAVFHFAMLRSTSHKDKLKHVHRLLRY